MAKKKVEEKINLDSILFKCRDILRQARNSGSFFENRLLDALLLLEKEFGILDDLDIDTTVKSPEEIQTIARQIYVIVYNDQSVHIGDGNRIKDTDISTVGK